MTPPRDRCPGDPPSLDFVNFFSPLDPGESVECEIAYRVNSHLDHQLSVPWTTRSVLDEDPNPANDSFVLVFGPAPPIPTLSPVGSAILILSLFLAFVAVRWQAGKVETR